MCKQIKMLHHLMATMTRQCFIMPELIQGAEKFCDVHTTMKAFIYNNVLAGDNISFINVMHIIMYAVSPIISTAKTSDHTMTLCGASPLVLAISL